MNIDYRNLAFYKYEIFIIPSIKEESEARKWLLRIVGELKNELNCSIFLFDDWVKDISKKSKIFFKIFEDLFKNGIKGIHNEYYYHISSMEWLYKIFNYPYYPTDYVMLFIENKNLEQIQKEKFIDERNNCLFAITTTPKNLDFAIKWNNIWDWRFFIEFISRVMSIINKSSIRINYTIKIKNIDLRKF